MLKSEIQKRVEKMLTEFNKESFGIEEELWE